MSDTFLIIGGISLVLLPITLIIFAIQHFRKKATKKKWGIAALVLLVCFAVFETVGIKTMCDHTFVKESNDENSITYKCIDCGAEKEESYPQQETDSNVISDDMQGAEDDAAIIIDNVVEETLPPVDSDIVSILMAEGYTVEHATAMQQLLNTVGITSIEVYGRTGSAEDGLNAMSCFANGSTEEKSRFTITTENGVVFYIGYLSEDLYDVNQGGYLKSYADVHVPQTEIDWDTFYTLQEIATEEVKACLNYPETANFHELAWAIGRSDDNYKIIGEVSAKNGFGVKDDVLFGVWFVANDGAFVVEGVTLNGIRVK